MTRRRVPAVASGAGRRCDGRRRGHRKRRNDDRQEPTAAAAIRDDPRKGDPRRRGSAGVRARQTSASRPSIAPRTGVMPTPT